MKVFKVNPEKIDMGIIERAAEVLRIGGVVVYPTETLYGLGANALDVQPAYKVFEIKGRDITKPISLAFMDLKHAKKFVYLAPAAEKLAEKFLPGPLTLIVNSKITLDEIFGGDRISIRIPDHTVAKALLEKTKFPITATSANLSGGKDPVEIKDVLEQLGDKIDLVLDAGKCKYGKPSTVVDATTDEIKIIREGVIDKKKLSMKYRNFRLIL